LPVRIWFHNIETNRSTLPVSVDNEKPLLPLMLTTADTAAWSPKTQHQNSPRSNYKNGNIQVLVALCIGAAFTISMFWYHEDRHLPHGQPMPPTVKGLRGDPSQDEPGPGAAGVRGKMLLVDFLSSCCKIYLRLQPLCESGVGPI